MSEGQAAYYQPEVWLASRGSPIAYVEHMYGGASTRHANLISRNICRDFLRCTAVKEQHLESEAERFSRAVEAEDIGQDAFMAEEDDEFKSDLQQQYNQLQTQVHLKYGHLGVRAYCWSHLSKKPLLSLWPDPSQDH